MTYPKEVLVRFLLQEFGDDIDLARIEAIGWDRTTKKIENQIDMLSTNLKKYQDEFDEADKIKSKKLKSKIKQKEMLLKWISKNRKKDDDDL
jgi:hypothetical protein